MHKSRIYKITNDGYQNIHSHYSLTFKLTYSEYVTFLLLTHLQTIALCIVYVSMDEIKVGEAS